jgi:hypothetical protein
MVVTSTDFERLEVPLSRLAQLAHADEKRLAVFEVDADGSFVYWPDLDMHLGWEHFRQIVDPAAALKEQQRSGAFNKRVGASVRRLRVEAGLGCDGIGDVSSRQLRRIEQGECRLTTAAIAAMAKAHRLSPKQYLEKVVSGASGL